MQQLVQDKSFLTAVQTSQLHAAATAAVRLLRQPQLAAPSEFKRPPDRQPTLGAAGVREPYTLGGGGGGGGGEGLDGATPRSVPSRLHSGFGGVGGGPAGGLPGSLVVPRQLVEPRHREAMRYMRLEVLGLEDIIPWNSVRRTWKSKRTSWRRQVKQTEVLADFAMRLKELRAALLTDEQPLPGCGSTWRAQLELCIQGKGSYGLLAAAWEEMRSTIRAWLEGRSKPATVSAAALQAGAVRAVRAMQAVMAGGGGGGDPGGEADAALLQVPLESIVGHDSGAGLHAVRHAIKLEQRIVGARLAGRSASQQQLSDGSGGDGAGGQPLVSYFSSISAAWADSDFDSAGSDAMEACSQGTDMDSDYDP